MVRLDLVLVLDKSGSVRSAQSSMLAFARELVSQFTLGVSNGAQIGIVEFSNDAAVLTPLTANLATLHAAINVLALPPALSLRGTQCVACACQLLFVLTRLQHSIQ